MSAMLQEYFEGKIDFAGQKSVDEIARVWLISSTVLAFVLGFVSQSLKVSFGLLGMSSVVLFAVVVPAWPMFNRHPVKWLSVLQSNKIETTKSK